jgi:hypothetical protein
MKTLISTLVCITFLLPLSTFAQLTNGGTNAYFGIDGDTRNNFVKYGNVSGLIPTDDWFSSSSSQYSVIDTSNAAMYNAFLSGGGNMGFNKRMSVPLFSKINGRLWLDAVYGRDFVATSPLFDSTVFSIAAKNGDNPVNWLGGTSNIPDKNDLLDVYAHMRRDGLNIHDSLWLFTGVSTVGTAGSRYFDIELYKKNLSYSRASGTFSSTGTEAGHTEWVFDAAGNVTQTGDMIIAANFTPGLPPVVDLRIWVSAATYASVIPAYFNFGPKFDGATPAYGYASILSKAGGTDFGSGISNYSATPTQDTTYSTPWGTEQTTKNWGAQYLTLQLVEVGLNLTRIGLDPALYTSNGLNPCVSMFSNIFFKSRSSNSFVSNMQDFVEPLTFLREPVMDFSLTPDTLRCNRPAGVIQITNNSTVGIYDWTTVTGNITGSNSDSTQVSLNKTGTYIVSASPALGCPATRVDTVKIPIDTFPPVASVNIGITSNFANLNLYGGDPAASNYATPFGGSQGLLWNWSGPGGFTASIQNATNDTTWGTYQLIVTEKRNGCKDTAFKTVSFFDFGVLEERNLNLTGHYSNQSIVLNWQNTGILSADYYEIQKSSASSGFATIGTVMHDSQGKFYYGFNDNHPEYGNNYYRIKCVTTSGLIFYSNTIDISEDLNGRSKYYLIQGNAVGKVSLACTMDQDLTGKIVMYTITGQVLASKDVRLYKGMNVVDLPPTPTFNHQVLVVSLFTNNQLSFTQKALF